MLCSCHRQTNSKYIGNMYVEELTGVSDLKGICLKHIMDCMKVEHAIDIVYTKAHSDCAFAREMVRSTCQWLSELAFVSIQRRPIKVE